MIGTRLGPYEITAKLGEGGMGEVYRATDSKLKREVAIKVLPAAFTEDRERLARFEREAQLLAQLHHPNIASVFGLEESAGTNALVMELVEGEDLSTILARGPVPLDDALAIARQIADALEAAHDHGIVHRDLKPANVKVRGDGTVKVLDFGLAKAAEQGVAAHPSNPATSPTLMNSPTLTRAHATQLGVILGTAAYMAPEQARGRNVDRRADIWAFGVVLYEMLTGRRAFPGDDVSDVLATVLKIEPEWSALPRDTPPAVRRLLRRCLEKDPRKRLSSIGDARLELDEHETEAAPVPMARRPALLARLWPAVAGAVLVAGIGALFWPHAGTKVAGEAIRTSILAPPGEAFVPDSTEVAISPDGRQVAFITGSTVPGAAGVLWVRRLDSLEAHQLIVGSGAQLPFWSPDSRHIGYFTDSKLCTVAAEGGRPEALADVGNARGGAWSSSNVIVFAPGAIGTLMRVSASGGAAVPATRLDAARGELGHRMPSFLPDGVHFLFASLPAKAGQFEISVGSLADGSRTTLGSMESAPVYAAPGWLLLTRQGGLGALRFDAAGLKLLGDPVSLVDQPTMILDPQVSYTAGRPISVSTSGTLAYYSSPSLDTKAVWLDSAGRVTGTLDLPPGHYEKVVISPDGSRAVLERTVSDSLSSLWLVDLVRGGASPLSSGSGRNTSPVWSPDGARVVFASDRDGTANLFVKTVADASPEQVFYRSAVLFKNAAAWSPDGRYVVMSQLNPTTQQDVLLLPTSGGSEPTLLVQGPLSDVGGPVSPDGRWMAYQSSETGRTEVYVRPFPSGTGKAQVSTQGASIQGGTDVWWTPDGRAILFVDQKVQTLWRVDMESAATLRVGATSAVANLPPGIVAMDATPDRKRFLALVPERVGAGSITVVQNWQAELKQR